MFGLRMKESASVNILTDGTTSYDLAERAAYVALLHDPRMTKARFRRGLARKATKQFRAAATGRLFYYPAFIIFIPCRFCNHFEGRSKLC
jgi:hypothetical protein